MFLLRAFPSYVGHLVLCLLAGPVLCPAFSMGLPEQVSLGLGVFQEAVLVHGQGFYARLKIDFSQFWMTGEVRCEEYGSFFLGSYHVKGPRARFFFHACTNLWQTCSWTKLASI